MKNFIKNSTLWILHPYVIMWTDDSTVPEVSRSEAVFTPKDKKRRKVQGEDVAWVGVLKDVGKEVNSWLVYLFFAMNLQTRGFLNCWEVQ